MYQNTHCNKHTEIKHTFLLTYGVEQTIAEFTLKNKQISRRKKRKGAEKMKYGDR